MKCSNPECDREVVPSGTLFNNSLLGEGELCSICQRAKEEEALARADSPFQKQELGEPEFEETVSPPNQQNSTLFQ